MTGPVAVAIFWAVVSACVTLSPTRFFRVLAFGGPHPKLSRGLVAFFRIAGALNLLGAVRLAFKFAGSE